MTEAEHARRVVAEALDYGLAKRAHMTNLPVLADEVDRIAALGEAQQPPDVLPESPVEGQCVARADCTRCGRERCFVVWRIEDGGFWDQCFDGGECLVGSPYRNHAENTIACERATAARQTAALRALSAALRGGA